MSRRTSFHPSSRRGFLGQLGALGGALAAATAVPALQLARPRRVVAAPPVDARFLFIVTASGGASIVDSFLPTAQSELSGEAAQRRIAYPDEAVVSPGGSNLRCVGNLPLDDLFKTDYSLATFLTKHGQDAAVVTSEVTSVNHVVAQQRAMTGNDIDGGRTLAEAVASMAPAAAILPSCNMSIGGYLEPGSDPTVLDRERAEVIANPLYFASATDPRRGVEGAPGAALFERARGVRDQLEQVSPFAGSHAESARRARILRMRSDLQPLIEDADLITRLMLLQDGVDANLSEYELETSPMAATVLEKLPNLASDRYEAQTALAFLLAFYGVSNVVTYGLAFNPEFVGGEIIDTPLAFDYSHTNHVVAQNVSWGRMMKSVDGLIDLLKSQSLGDGTMWDRSMIFVATDFGRDKLRPPGSMSFSTGHHLNNGNLIVSPLIKGNRVFGGLDKETGLTYGFDPATGEADPGRVMSEGDIYSLVAQAMGVSFDGQTDMSALLR